MGHVWTARLPSSPEGPAHLLALAFSSDGRTALPCGGVRGSVGEALSSSPECFFKFKDSKDLEFGFIFLHSYPHRTVPTVKNSSTGPHAYGDMSEAESGHSVNTQTVSTRPSLPGGKHNQPSANCTPRVAKPPVFTFPVCLFVIEGRVVIIWQI